MIDTILFLAGSGAVCVGLWTFSPSLALVVIGSVMLALAFGRYRQRQPPSPLAAVKRK